MKWPWSRCGASWTAWCSSGSRGSEAETDAMTQVGAAPAAAAPDRPADLLDVARIRRDFPILSQVTRRGHPLVYLDNAATTQKPRQVIEAVSRFYATGN